ncbi:hypothetical protein BGZ58_006800 [Dissophora ornata]|nr:hypothetical protein BGZ58_006800 [Dissophora ornata]
MSDTIPQDATPHPRQGIRRSPHPHSDDDDSDNENVNTRSLHPQSTSSSSSRPHSRQSSSKTKDTTGGAGRSFKPSIFGHPKSRHDDDKTKTKIFESDSDFDGLEDDDKEEDSEGGAAAAGRTGAGRKGKSSRRRKRRISDSASHLLAQAPPVPDLRFDSNYRKALDQIYETHARESAIAAEIHAAKTSSSPSPSSSSSSSEKPKQQQHEHRINTVPSVAARITVMTLRDIIITPFVHGFFWGFGTVVLTLVAQRSLLYHVRDTWRKIFGGNITDVPIVVRGEPARVRRVGTSGFGGIGLMNAGSGLSQQQTGFGNPAGRAY